MRGGQISRLLVHLDSIGTVVLRRQLLQGRIR